MLHRSCAVLLVWTLAVAICHGQAVSETVVLQAPSLPPAGTLPERLEVRDEPFLVDTEESAISGWFSAEYLMWWVEKGPLAGPLVTTGPLTDPFPGTLDQANTRILFGDRGLDFGTFAGMRFNGGIWLNRLRLGLEASWALLEKRSTSFSIASDATGSPLLGRPFVNALTGNENIYIDAVPGGITGAIGIAAATRFWVWDTDVIVPMFERPALQGALLVGFRSLGLDEDLRIQDRFTSVAAGGGAIFQLMPVDPPAFAGTFDHFKTSNRFYGPQVGGRLGWQRGALALTALTKLAMGVSQQVAVIEGVSTLTTPGAPTLVASGGTLAQNTNIGRYVRDEFAVIPEVGLNMGWQISRQLRAQVGYTFLYWSRVARPGDQIDRVVNPNQVPTDPAFGTPGGPARPAFAFHESDFWAQGLNFGLEFSY